MPRVIVNFLAAICVAVGNPAKVVRKRFDEELIELLEQTQWWDLPIEEIQALIPILTSPDLEGLKAELKKRSAKPSRKGTTN